MIFVLVFCAFEKSSEKCLSYLMKIAIESPQKLSNTDLETIVGIWTRKPRKIVKLIVIKAFIKP